MKLGDDLHITTVCTTRLDRRHPLFIMISLFHLIMVLL